MAQRGGWLTEARRKLPSGRGTAPRNTSWGGRAVVGLWEPRKGGIQLGLVQGDFLEEAGFKRGQWGEASAEAARTYALPWPRSELLLLPPPLPKVPPRPTVPGSGQSFLGLRFSSLPTHLCNTNLGKLLLWGCHPGEFSSQPTWLAACPGPPAELPLPRPLIASVPAAPPLAGLSSSLQTGQTGCTDAHQVARPAALKPGVFKWSRGTALVSAPEIVALRWGRVCVAVNFAFWRPWAPASCHAPLVPGVFSHCSCPQMLTGGLTDTSRATGCSYSAALKSFIVRGPNRDSVGTGDGCRGCLAKTALSLALKGDRETRRGRGSRERVWAEAVGLKLEHLPAQPWPPGG